MKRSHICIGISILLAVWLSGCAHRGPILVDFAYERPPQAGAEPSTGVVGIAPFKDDRGKTESVVGKRFNSLKDEADDLVVQGTVSGKVTTALKNAMKDRDIAFKDIAAWDLTDTGISADAGKLLLGGEIKTLWVETSSSFANTKVKASVALRVLIGDPAKKKIIRTLNVSSTSERQSITFSTDDVDAALTEALSAAINQLFNDEELKNRLK